MHTPLPEDTLRQEAESQSSVTLRTISALGTLTSDAFHASTHFNDLLRASSRHCRRLVGARAAHIWIARRGGRRLGSREFSDDPSALPREHRLARGEGLTGWVVEHQQALRLGPGDPRPAVTGLDV